VSRHRRLLLGAALGAVTLLMVAGSWLVGPRPAGAADAGAVSRADAIEQLGHTRASIDETLALFKAGRTEAALEQAQSGYLRHFELVEVPLRVADPQLTLDAEQKFAEIRQLIRSDAPTSEVRDRIVELRGMVDSAERKLSSPGLVAPALVTGQSFLIIFREGLEAVLLLSVLLGYLEASKATHAKRPILWGVAAAVAATAATAVVLRVALDLAPAGREMLEAITAVVAVAMLFWVSFWLISRLDHKRWMEFLRSRVWTAVSLGSAASLALIGFTAVYREGFETVLFYQALLSFGEGLTVWVALGFVLGAAALAACSWAIFRLGRRLPLKAFLTTAVVLIMATSVAFLGNAVAALQEVDVLQYHRLDGWPRFPIFLAEATGYRPTVETVLAQAALTLVYVIGALLMFLALPAWRRRREGPGAGEAGLPGVPTPGASTPAGSTVEVSTVDAAASGASAVVVGAAGTDAARPHSGGRARRRSSIHSG